MSQLEAETVACPACGAAQQAQVFRSLNGERVPEQVDRVLAGTFEAITCACGHEFRIEHTMLYTHYPLRTWIVMHPPVDRSRFASIEHGVLLVFERDFRAAPAPVAVGLRGVRPRLVFGQAALSEAVRVAQSGLDPIVLECAKLLVFRRNLGLMLDGAPAELLFEGAVSPELPPAAPTEAPAETTAEAPVETTEAPAEATAPTDAPAPLLQFGLIELTTGRRRGALTVAADILDEVAQTLPEWSSRYPDLFARPYLSATRYLFGADLTPAT